MKAKSKKKPFPLSGALLVNKPKGMTSHDVVNRLRRSLNTKAVGHTGTLDPMAEGLMVLLIEKATKLSQWIVTEEKTYTGRVKFGETTDTDDAEGEILERSAEKVELDIDELRKKASELKGEIDLDVPRFSAIKMKGKKLYDKARQGEDFEPPKKTMNFYASEIQEVFEEEATFYIHCSKGTYIRSWAREMGRAVKSYGAHLTKLRRESVGSHKLSEALELEDLQTLEDKEEAEKVSFIQAHSESFIPLEYILNHAEPFFLSESEQGLFSNGQIPNKARLRLNPLIRHAQKSNQESLLRVLDKTHTLKGLVSIAPNGKLKIKKVFND